MVTIIACVRVVMYNKWYIIISFFYVIEYDATY